MNPRLRQLLRQDLKQIINDFVDYELPEITAKTDIQKDLGFDSLDVVELLIDLGNQYQISISDEEFEKVRTFQELCDLMQSILTTPNYLTTKTEKMKDNRLISMTNFVLEQRNNRNQTVPECLNSIFGYADFLKQPLKLEMFVPCDEDGNVLKEPKNYKQWKKKALNTPYDLDLNKYETYQQSKEKVLFEWFMVVEYSDKTIEIMSDTAPNFIIPFKRLNKKNWEQRYSCIEDLLASIVDIELTPTAIKQIQP